MSSVPALTHLSLSLIQGQGIMSSVPALITHLSLSLRFTDAHAQQEIITSYCHPNQGSERRLSTQNFNDCIYENCIDFYGASERQN